MRQTTWATSTPALADVALALEEHAALRLRSGRRGTGAAYDKSLAADDGPPARFIASVIAPSGSGLAHGPPPAPAPLPEGGPLAAGSQLGSLPPGWVGPLVSKTTLKNSSGGRVTTPISSSWKAGMWTREPGRHQ